MPTISGVESKVTGILKTDLAIEAQTATIDVDFFDEDDNSVSVTLQSDTLEFTIDPLNETGNGSERIIAASTTADTPVTGRTRLSTVERGLYRYGTGQTGVAANAKSWAQGTRVAVSTDSLMRGVNILKSYVTADPNDKTFSGDVSFTKSMSIPSYADDAARDAAITSPVDGMLIYNEDTDVINQYIGGAWVDTASGTTATATESSSGKSELATLAEQGAHTETGSEAVLVLQSKNTLKTPAIYTPAYLTGDTGADGTYTNWIAVSDGSFQITIDGAALDITGIDFSSVTSMADVATAIQTAIQTATSSTETCVWSTDHFVISSVDTTSSSAITVMTAGTAGTDISGAGASDWMDCDTGNGVVTDKVLDQTQDENKVVVLGSDGKVNDLFQNISAANATTLTDGSDASALHTHGETIQAGTGNYAGTGASGNIDIDLDPFTSSGKYMVRYVVKIKSYAYNNPNYDANHIVYDRTCMVGEGFSGVEITSTENTAGSPVFPTDAVSTPQGGDTQTNMAIAVYGSAGHSIVTTIVPPVWSSTNLRFAYTNTVAGTAHTTITIAVSATKIA